jgi:hypothetical protein
MSDLTPRPDYKPRRTREQRAYRLVMAGGIAGTVAVVGAVLAVVGVIGFGIPLLAAVVAAVCGLLFRRTVSS